MIKKIFPAICWVTYLLLPISFWRKFPGIEKVILPYAGDFCYPGKKVDPKVIASKWITEAFIAGMNFKTHGLRSKKHKQKD